ncbi:unnamed protein product [Closterium sp. Yama58-4]|nr:unnamed protein product [Closterium sp. Yama58-4]
MVVLATPHGTSAMAPQLPVESGAAHHPHANSEGALPASAGSEGGKAEQSPPSPPAKGVAGDAAAALSPALVASGDEGKAAAAALSRHSITDWLAMLLWLGCPHILLALLVLIALSFPHPLAIALLLLLATLAFTPVDVEGPLAHAYRRWLYPVVLRHFPVRMLFRDQSALTFGKPYVIALEPHSVLPVGLGAFLLHPLSAGGVVGATSAVFRVPLLRHSWGWVRVVPATRAVLSAALQRGRPVILVPGGVQECVFMAPGKEVAFVRQRLGFIRLALQHGVPVLPCFAFGQTSAYRWWRPEGEWYRWVARRLRFAPILFWGVWGLPIPFRTPLTIVIGTPIGQGDPDPNPSKERVAAVHAEYVRALERLFLDYRAQAGYPTTELEIM